MRIDGREVRLSRHAVSRYHERLRPGIPPEQAFDDLRRLCRSVGRVVEMLPWAYNPDVDGYLALGEDFALPLRETEGILLATTLLERTGTNERVLAERRYRKARRRAAKRFRRQWQDGMARPDEAAA